eukprot:8032-Heterococcus_DN1.PRE.3
MQQRVLHLTHSRGLMLQASYAIASNNEATRVHKLAGSIQETAVLLLARCRHNLEHARTRSRGSQWIFVETRKHSDSIVSTDAHQQRALAEGGAVDQLRATSSS